MPGFCIHLIIAKEYNRKHKNEIKDFDEFCKGTIKPDLNDTLDNICKDKLKSHYGILRPTNDGTFYTDLPRFVKENLTKIKTDFYKGYLLHLLADDYFYNDYFNSEVEKAFINKESFHSDFDAINSDLESKYDFKLPKELLKYTGENNNSPKYLDFDRVCDYIDKISNIDLEKILDDEIRKL